MNKKEEEKETYFIVEIEKGSYIHSLDKRSILPEVYTNIGSFRLAQRFTKNEAEQLVEYFRDGSKVVQIDVIYKEAKP